MKAFHLDPFRDYLALEAGASSNTLDNYLRDIRRLVQWGKDRGITKPEAVTIVQLREFVYALKDLGLQPSTIRRQISALRTYFKFLTGEGLVVRDPTEQLDAPKGWRRLPTVLTVPEVERLVGAPDADTPLGVRDRALLELCYATGARVSELVALRLSDLVFEEGLARLYGKGSKERLVPVGRRALGAAALYAREIRPTLDRGRSRGVLFVNARGGPLKIGRAHV